MRKGHYFALLLLLINSVSGQWKSLTLDEIFKQRTFKPATLGKWKWTPDEDAFVFFEYDSLEEGRLLLKYNLITGDTSTFMSEDQLVFETDTLRITDFWISENGNGVLLQTHQKRIWRHSRTGIYYHYDLLSKQLIQLAKGSKLRNVKYSPNGLRIAYVKMDNNIYVFNITAHKERRLTRDGSEVILNGHLGWVYEEEFGSYDGYRWSPDSKHIAFWREDQSEVKRFTLINEMDRYPTTTKIYYPLVGEKNPVMQIGVVNVNNRRTKWMDLGPETDIYFPLIEWEQISNRTDYRQLIVYRLNRHQNHLELLRFDVKKGKGRVFYSDRNEAWIDVPKDLHFQDDGSFILESERSGYNHFYRHDYEGNYLNAITQGNWEVSSIIGVDEESGKVYFTGKKEAVIEQHIYSVNLDGSNLTHLSTESGWHKVYLSPLKKYVIDFYSNARTPTRISLLNTNGNLVRLLKETDITKFEDYGLTYPEFIQVATSDGRALLNAMITLPRDFDQRKKYPVLIYGYAGPGSQVVTNSWGGNRFLWHQYMSQQGYICFSIDNRGTGGQGKAFKNLIYGDLGKWAVQDHIEGVKYLRSLAYVDRQRIGIWGWSGGGYLTSMCMTKGAPYFQVGVAVAPVTDFRLYDTIWTERYMGMLAENEQGYENTSVFTYIDRLEGKLLLIHGTGDDNVHSQNSLQLVNKLLEADKHVDMLFYPNKNHSIRGQNTRYHLYTGMSQYFLDNL